MAKALLDAINEVFKRTNNIQGDAAALTSLTDSARQHEIDVTIQVINEGIDELYSQSHIQMPNQQAESTITLVAGTRSYTLPTNLVSIIFPLRDKVNTTFIWLYPEGYNGLLDYDPDQTFTGLPYWAAISPINGQLFMSCTPTANENGRVFTYQYEKDLALALATDTVPFDNTVFRAMVPAWVQLYKREMRNEFDQQLYQMAMGRASRYLSEIQPRQSYSPRGG